MYLKGGWGAKWITRFYSWETKTSGAATTRQLQDSFSTRGAGAFLQQSYYYFYWNSWENAVCKMEVYVNALPFRNLQDNIAYKRRIQRQDAIRRKTTINAETIVQIKLRNETKRQHLTSSTFPCNKKCKERSRRSSLWLTCTGCGNQFYMPSIGGDVITVNTRTFRKSAAQQQTPPEILIVSCICIMIWIQKHCNCSQFIHYTLVSIYGCNQYQKCSHSICGI